MLPTALIGREAELAFIIDSLKNGNTRLLTLTGPGGTGKTRLALHAAAELLASFENGVFFVDLAAAHTPELVLEAIARTIGIRETSDHPLLEEIKSHLRNQKLLLLLDNFEQVIAAAPLTVELLECKELKIIATSREPLHVRGEHIYPIPPLTLPALSKKALARDEVIQYEAVRLFAERAQAVKPDFDLTNENIPAIVEICTRLDGLPLAIELAAARIRLFSPQALLERLKDRFKLLRGGARDLPPRQQALQSTIDWSYELLETGEQRLFEMVSVFSGGATLDAVETVAEATREVEAAGIDILDGMTSLVDKSLLRMVDQENGELRVMMLATLREYAGDKLAKTPDFYTSVRRSHASYYADFAQKQWEELDGADREKALVDLEVEIENLRKAWAFWAAESDLEKLSQFVDSLWMLYDVRGWFHSTIDLTTDLLNILSSTPYSPERARQEIVLQTSLARALFLIKGGLTQEVEEAFNRAFELSQRSEGLSEILPVLRGLAAFYTYQSEFVKGAEFGEKLLGLADQHNDPRIRVDGHLVIGSNLGVMGMLKKGLEHLDKGIAYNQPEYFRSRRFQLGQDPGVACYTTSSLFLWMLGFPDQARERESSAIDLAVSLKHPLSLAYVLFHSGLLHLWMRKMDIVQDRAEKVFAIAHENDFPVWKAVAVCLKGAAMVNLGEAQAGLDQIHQGVLTYKGLKTPPVFWPELLFVQASAYSQAGRYKEGLSILNEAVDLTSRETGKCDRSEYCRLKGEILWAISPDNKEEAESNFRQALASAQQQEARMLELRTALSLSRLWKKHGRTSEGRALLNRVYSAMTEGFDLPDLQDSRLLLEDLA